MKVLKQTARWGGLILITVLALSATGCRFNFSSGNQGDPIKVTEQEQAQYDKIQSEQELAEEDAIQAQQPDELFAVRCEVMASRCQARRRIGIESLFSGPGESVVISDRLHSASQLGTGFGAFKHLLCVRQGLLAGHGTNPGLADSGDVIDNLTCQA